jgi:LytS/YehU family sensor histidine kinase
MLPTGIAISHFYRLFIKRIKLFQFNIPSQILAIIVFSFLNGSLYFLIDLFLLKAMGLSIIKLNLVKITELVINFSVVFAVWNVIYFGFQYFQNYKQSEINALKYFAASKESELNNLKAQLNPHFIFNCMNSIRALIDENPDKAKAAVTQLSNILRNTLLIDKSPEINLKDEISLVNDYLQLEKIRYEERLNYFFDISEEAGLCLIPPFIIQTQVENAIKHGISKIPGNGNIYIKAFVNDQFLTISVCNTGKMSNDKPLTGVGFKNSKQRLELLYGKSSSIDIREQDNNVHVVMRIPLLKT